MKFIIKLVTFCACAVLVAYAFGPPDPPNYWITTVQEQGGTVVLDAYIQINDTNNTDLLLNHHVYGWMLPDLTILNVTYNDTRRWVDNQLWFVITNVSHYDFGQYHCMLRHNDTLEIEMVKLGLNLRGPFFQDLWLMYRLNTIIGISSMVGFFFLCVIFWLFWRYRWIDPEKREKQNELKEEQNGGSYIIKVDKDDELGALKANESYENAGYVDHDNAPVYTLPGSKEGFGEDSHSMNVPSGSGTGSSSPSPKSTLTHRSHTSGSGHPHMEDMTAL